MFASGRYDWNLWLWWVVQTTAGYSLAMIALVLAILDLGILVVASGSETESSSIWLQLSFTPLFALSRGFAGLLQWISRRSVLASAGWWVPVSGITLAFRAAGSIFGGVYGGVLAWSAAGSTSGLAFVWMLTVPRFG